MRLTRNVRLTVRCTKQLEFTALDPAKKKMPCTYPQNWIDPFVNGLHLNFCDEWLTKLFPIWTFQNQTYPFVNQVVLNQAYPFMKGYM